MGKRSVRWNEDQLRAAVAKASCVVDVLRLLGLVTAGGNHATIKHHITRLGLDTSHFSTERVRLRGFKRSRDEREIPLEKVFCENSAVSRNTLRKRALGHLLPVLCAWCGNCGEHNGESLTLHLDHVNGVGNDNRIENLRWLCPNCHSQTDTYAGRNLKQAV
jgi:hypothetical protein